MMEEHGANRQSVINKTNNQTSLLANEKLHASLTRVGGVLFTFAVAGIGLGLAQLPVAGKLGPMVLAILIAIVYRQLWGYPARIAAGIQFSAKKILRFAIILYGFKLNIDVIIHQGLGLMGRDIVTILIALAVTMLSARKLKADRSLSFMLAVGTGVCGAAAIAAVSPLIKAKEEDTAIGVGIIALMGTIFTVIYTLLLPVLPLSSSQYGIWSGISLHEIAHVAAAAAPAGSDALAIALLAKLGRVLLLVPLCFIITYWLKRKNNKETEETRVDFPWFLVGFIATAALGTYLPIPHAAMETLSSLGSFLLTAAMVGLGLNVSFQVLKTRALKPLVAMFAASVVLSVITFFSILI
jgi:uncharacterized integral membrane protein (TIGR00698 family)